MNSPSSTGWDALRIRNDLNPPRRSCREGWSPSRTPSTAQKCWSKRRASTELKIMQQQVGHEHASTTSIYTCVSSDFRVRTLRKALDTTVGAAMGGTAPGRTAR